MRRALAAVALWWVSSAASSSSSSRQRNAKLSLFDRSRPEEALLDQYALALAATERARELRDASIRKAVGRWRWTYLRAVKRANVCDAKAFGGARDDPEWRGACARHAATSAKIIEAVSGLSVADFNRLSRRIAENPALKEKVLHQAYLYRVASKIDDSDPTVVLPRRDLLSSLGDAPAAPPRSSSALVAAVPAAVSPPARRSRGGEELSVTSPESMRRLAALVRRVEALRLRQRAELLATLNLDDEERPLCDDALLPFAAPHVRDACQAFAQKAADLVESHGVQFASFERCLDKADKNLLFRWRLHRAVNHLPPDDFLSSDDRH